MKGAILLLAISACLRAQQGSLEGTAVHAVTREPLSNVHVRLVAAGFNGITGAYGAMSDRTGHFSIATMRPGTYILLPERAGYLHVQAKGSTGVPTITIKPGEHVTGYQLEMTPRALISGRVVDEAGDPVQGARVEAVPATPEKAPVVMMPVPNPATDDRGEFRLTTAPGKYYVQATAGNRDVQERPEIRSDGTSEAIYATTFYPSSVRKDRGTILEAVAGKEVGGIEIRLARQQQGLSISGVVSGIPDGPSRGYVAMQFGESARRITSGRSTAPGADGKFHFDGLQPGFYRIWAVYNDAGKTQLASRTMEWQLENSEIANVELALVPGVELSGTLRIEGEAAGTAAKRMVKLEPAMGYFMVNMGMTGGEVDGDGAFHIANIAPAKYRVKVSPLAENAYIKTLEIDGVAATNGVADLSRATRTPSAKMTVGGNGAQISGRVLDANGEPMATNVVMIFLARDAEDIPLTGNGTVQATQDGKYTIKAIVPGKYRLFALDAFQMSNGNDMDALKKLFDRGEEIEFKEGDRITKNLKVIPLEDPNAKPNK
jgi:protocatechuate 3,4-dioxygenase beta subunit